jgi:hypothetical protein
MNKFKAFGYFLIQKPIMLLYIIINVLLISFVVKLSLEPLVIPFVGKVFISVPWWIQNLCFIIFFVKNMYSLYVQFEKWYKNQNLFLT